MRLIVLGNGPVTPNPGGACSGYLVESGQSCLLLDCGNGVVAAPELKAALPQLSAVLISHLHIDHWLDLAPLSYELKYSPRLVRTDRLPVWVPKGSGQKLLDLLHLLALGSHFAEEVFEVAEYDAQSVLRIGDAEVSFREMEHYVTSYAMHIEAAGRVIVYSADTAPCEALVALARDADLFLCEAADPIDGPLSEPRGHLNALEAGQIAAQAGVKRLLLTHLWHHYNQETLLQAARSVYSGPCELAEQGRSYPIA